MHKSFSFKGMTRSNDNLLAADGETLELVNMRIVNGSLRPIPELVERARVPGCYSKVFWHEMAECYLCISNDAKAGVVFRKSDWTPLLDSNGHEAFFSELESVLNIEFIGYMVICLTGKGIFFMVFDKGIYRWLGERPPVPQMTVSISPKLHEITTSVSFASEASAGTLESSWKYNEKGYIDECISYLNKKGYYIDRSLFRFALRLFDGSYIYCSHVIYVANDNVTEYVGRDASNLVSECEGSSSDMSPYKVKVMGFKPTFEFTSLNLEEWEGVVVGIDIFATGSIMGKKPDAFMVTLHDSGSSVRSREMVEAYVEKELEELWNDISCASQFYKVAEFDLKGKPVEILDDVSQESLCLQQALGSSEMPHSMATVSAACCYMMNNRLHVGNLKEYFFKGYDAISLQPSAMELKEVRNVVVQTKIKTRNSTSAVVKEYGAVKLGFLNGTWQLPALLSYPDSRACEMTLLVDTGSKRLKKVFQLTAHRLLNISQYLHHGYLGYKVTVAAHFASGGSVAYVAPEDVLKLFGNEVGVHEVVYSSSLGGWTYDRRPFPPEAFSSLRVFAIPRDVVDGDRIVFSIEYGVDDTSFKDIGTVPVDSTWETVGDDFVLSEENVYEERPNVVKVSMVDNPFIFPAKSVYSPSQGKVLAMACNTVALSQGQFGEHPLYLFCDNGIWVMGVDTSGATAYTASFPLSREVCNNPSLMCSVDSGVVFSTARGIMLLSGNKLRCISSAMECDKGFSSRPESSVAFQTIASTLFGGEQHIGVGFDAFMDNAGAAYVPSTSEILFYNADYASCFLYSLVHGAWSRVACRLGGYISRYPLPEFFVCAGGETRVSALSSEVCGTNKILLFTRPLLWGSKLPKRVVQLMLHVHLSAPEDGYLPFLGCYLLCSNDGANFKIVSGCEKNRECGDVVFPYFPTQSYKYFALAIIGRVGSGTLIAGTELDIQFVWNNRLR